MVPGLLPVPEEYLLSFSREIVRVKEHDRFLSCLAFGNDFRRVLVDGSLLCLLTAVVVS